MIARFSPIASYIGTGEYIGDTESDPDGEYVLYDDYKRDSVALRAENAELSARISELTSALTEAEEGVRKLYEWAYAQEWETEEEQIVGEVTREMATDAGEPGMVGMPVYGKVKATWVLAESGEPWRSLRDDNEFVQRALRGEKQ